MCMLVWWMMEVSGRLSSGVAVDIVSLLLVSLLWFQMLTLSRFNLVLTQSVFFARAMSDVAVFDVDCVAYLHSR
jgi:hypothetical protein